MASTIPADLIEEFKSLFTGKDQVITPESPRYDESLQRWSDLASQRPGAIVYPECTEDVSKAVLFARGHNLDLAVKGGGHTPDGGNSSDGGIVIDLGRMKKVYLYPDTKTLVAQGGALWRDVNNATSESGLAVVSSSVGTTGVGGVTVQGGFGYLIGSHGLIIDNLQSVQIVTADGQLRTASEFENVDLFWAVRGAGQNFGVVVEFTFHAHEQPDDVFAGSLVYSVDKLETILETLHAALQYKDGKTAAQCVIHQPPDASDVMINITLFHNGPEKECRERLVNIFNLEAVSTDVRPMRYEDVNSMLDSFSPAGRRKRLLGFDFTAPLRLEFTQKLVNEVRLQFEAEPDIRRSYLDIEFWPMSKVSQVPTTAMAFPNRTNTQKGSISIDYTDPAKDAEYLRWGKKIKTMFEEEFRRAGFEPNMLVSNFNYYTGSSSDITVYDMYGVNAQRLVELKQKYDPQGIFDKINPISTELCDHGM